MGGGIFRGCQDCWAESVAEDDLWVCRIYFWMRNSKLCELMSSRKCSPGILFAFVSISRLNFFRFERVTAARDQWNNECQSRSAGTFYLFYFQVGGRLVNSTSIYLLLLIIFTTQTEFQLTTSEGIQRSISSWGRRWLVYLTLLARIGRSSDDLWVGRTELRKWPRLKILLSRVSVRGSTYC